MACNKHKLTQKQIKTVKSDIREGNFEMLLATLINILAALRWSLRFMCIYISSQNTVTLAAFVRTQYTDRLMEFNSYA